VVDIDIASEPDLTCAVDIEGWRQEGPFSLRAEEQFLLESDDCFRFQRIGLPDLPADMVAAADLTVDLFLVFRLPDVTGFSALQLSKYTQDAPPLFPGCKGP
jgi:hypothetical protein